MANKKSSINKKATSTKNNTSNVKTKKETFEKSSKARLILKVIILVILIIAIVIGLTKACDKDEKVKDKKDKKPVAVIEDDNNLKDLDDNSKTNQVVIYSEIKQLDYEVTKEESKTETIAEEEIIVSDSTAPVVTGVRDGEVGSSFIINAMDDKTETSNLIVKIDNEDYTLGEEYTINGDHTLVVTDEAGNKTIINFTVAIIVVDGADEAADLNSIIANAEDGDIIALSSDIEDTTLEIPADKEITLDLNGKNIKLNSGSELVATIYNSGDLIIRDSKGEGKIIADYSFVTDDGLITIESGNIEVYNDYAIFCINGGKVVINGGVITSLYAPLTGNNTTGIMDFVVNSGTLTAEQGPAVYMPGPVSLTVTGGTLNGGISLRMGIVNISGGTINAITNYIDLPTDIINGKPAYTYSGNVWFPDAIYVLGGTYTTDVVGANNNLELNIIGGTINNQNGQGSAVAIYDLGKVAQNMNIKITDAAVLSTNATNGRKAFDVLSLADIGVTTPEAGYDQIHATIIKDIAQQYNN